jgi:hypothetical protein
MARQYKLRLRDGTVLAVDQAGLRTWLIDDRAMVQPMGTRAWRPLREVLAEEAVMGARTRPEAVRRTEAARTVADDDIAIPVKPATLDAPATPDPTLDAPDQPLVSKRPAPTAGPLPLVPPPPADAPIRPAAAAPALPLVPPPAPVAAPPRAPVASAPLAAVSAPVRAAAVPASAPPRATPPPVAVAPPPVAAPAPRAATAAPPVAAPAPRVALATPPVIATPPRAAAPVAAPPAPAKAGTSAPPVLRPAPTAFPDPPEAATLGPLIPEPPPEDAPARLEDLPIIPLKPIEDDEDVAAPSVSLRVAGPSDRLEETDLADQLALVIQREVAEGNAVVIPEDELEELDLLEDEEFAPARGPVQSSVPEPLAAAVATGFHHVADWVRSATAVARTQAASAASVVATVSEAVHGRSEAAQPPPASSELPVIPFAKEAPPASGGVRRRIARAGLAAAVLAGTVAAGAGTYAWIQSRSDGPVAAVPAAPPPPPVTAAPELPREVVAAIEQLPHLAPATVQRLIATSPFAAPEPADVFRRARQALKRGIPALAPEEAQQLSVLERAVLVRLGPADRERVMAYDRVRAGRDLLPKEDARVLALYARGARALPAEHRERLQALSAKAIDAALAAAPVTADQSVTAPRR